MNYLHLHTWNEENSNTIPILVLHGFTGSGLDFEYFGRDKALSNYGWYAPDIMGHGKTPISKDPRDYTFETHIGYLDCIINEKIKRPFILLGYSMGGRLALRYALERPSFIQKLILVSTTPGIIDRHERLQRRQTDDALSVKILEEGIYNFINFWQEQDIIKSQKNMPTHIYRLMLNRKFKNNALGLSNSLKAMGTGMMEPLWHRLSEIEFPVMWITGEKDVKFTRIAQEMNLAIPHGIHEIIPNVGHSAIWENLDFFIQLITKKVYS